VLYVMTRRHLQKVHNIATNPDRRGVDAVAG
jgi:hypothetical protein